GGSIVLIGPESLTEISVHDKFIGNNGIAVKPDGTGIYIPTIASDTRNARILSIDLTDPTGTQNIVTEGDNLSLVAGLRVFQESGGTGSPPPSPSVIILRDSDRQENDSDLPWKEREVSSMPAAAQQPVQLLSQPFSLVRSEE